MPHSHNFRFCLGWNWAHCFSRCARLRIHREENLVLRCLTADQQSYQLHDAKSEMLAHPCAAHPSLFKKLKKLYRSCPAEMLPHGLWWSQQKCGHVLAPGTDWIGTSRWSERVFHKPESVPEALIQFSFLPSRECGTQNNLSLVLNCLLC